MLFNVKNYETRAWKWPESEHLTSLITIFSLESRFINVIWNDNESSAISRLCFLFVDCIYACKAKNSIMLLVNPYVYVR